MCENHLFIGVVGLGSPTYGTHTKKRETLKATEFSRKNSVAVV